MHVQMRKPYQSPGQDEKLILLYCPGRGLNSRPPAHCPSTSLVAQFDWEAFGTSKFDWQAFGTSTIWNDTRWLVRVVVVMTWMAVVLTNRVRGSLILRALHSDRSTVSGKHTRAFNGHSTDRLSQHDENNKSKRRQREFIHSRLENVV